MLKYDNAKALFFLDTLSRGTKYVGGTFYYGAWHIQYYLAQPGLVIYTVMWDEYRFKVHAMVQTTVVFVGITISVVATGGISAPAYSLLFAL